MKLKILFIILILTITITASIFTPTIAINPITKECGYSGHAGNRIVEEPWEKQDLLSITECNPGYSEKTLGAQECCEQLGYTYIGQVGNPPPTILGIKQTTIEKNIEIIILIIIIILGIMSIIIFKLKQTTELKTRN